MNTKYIIVENYKGNEKNKKVSFLNKWIKIIKAEMKNGNQPVREEP